MLGVQTKLHEERSMAYRLQRTILLCVNYNNFTFMLYLYNIITIFEAPPLARICNPCLHRNLFHFVYEVCIWP